MLSRYSNLVSLLYIRRGFQDCRTLGVGCVRMGYIGDTIGFIGVHGGRICVVTGLPAT